MDTCPFSLAGGELSALVFTGAGLVVAAAAALGFPLSTLNLEGAGLAARSPVRRGVITLCWDELVERLVVDPVNASFEVEEAIAGPSCTDRPEWMDRWSSPPVPLVVIVTIEVAFGRSEIVSRPRLGTAGNGCCR